MEVAAEASSLALLSPGEREFLRRLAEGLSYVQIAGCMDISVNTVRSYVRSAYKKLSVNSRTRAVVKYLESPSRREDERADLMNNEAAS